MYLKPKKVTTKKKLKLHFKINDYVRISHKSMLFDRSYNEHFTQEMVKVCQRFRMQGICMYTLKDFLNEDIKGHFYASELQKVNKNEDSLWFIEKLFVSARRVVKYSCLSNSKDGPINITNGYQKKISNINTIYKGKD